MPNQVASQIPLGGTASNYAFNHPATATPVNSSAALGTRTTQTLSGYFGGIMYPVVGNSPGSPYVATGTTTVMTNATTNRVAASFTGDATAGTTVLNSIQFGGFSGTSRSRSTFVDDARYAALENPDAASQINYTNIQLNGDPTKASHVAMVSSGMVTNPLLPSGGLCSACQFLQWGYWTGALGTPNAAGTAIIRQDIAHINPWIAGVMSNPVPATGTGSFTGNAFGSVVNNGASYLAVGTFSNNYNFGTRTGNLLFNFDGGKFSGLVTGGFSPTYAGTLAGTGGGTPVTGTANGAFFGPMAPETGGNFGVHSIIGSSYLASGIFAGKR